MFCFWWRQIMYETVVLNYWTAFGSFRIRQTAVSREASTDVPGSGHMFNSCGWNDQFDQLLHICVRQINLRQNGDDWGLKCKSEIRGFLDTAFEPLQALQEPNTVKSGNKSGEFSNSFPRVPSHTDLILLIYSWECFTAEQSAGVHLVKYVRAKH